VSRAARYDDCGRWVRKLRSEWLFQSLISPWWYLKNDCTSSRLLICRDRFSSSSPSIIRLCTKFGDTLQIFTTESQWNNWHQSRKKRIINCLRVFFWRQFRRGWRKGAPCVSPSSSRPQWISMTETTSRKLTGGTERAAAPCRERGVSGEVHHAPVVADPASAVRVGRPHGSRMSRSVLADGWSLPWTRGWGLPSSWPPPHATPKGAGRGRVWEGALGHVGAGWRWRHRDWRVWQPAQENIVLSPKTNPLWPLSNSKVSSCR
jgi:hypothetical protein